ncbi:hypothetical protein [Gimesia sp.]|uniref:hypothetical protein n=1 Tax=Gimesia sp. TaxID=2024833 RepID=UPI003A8F2348
MQKNTRKYVLLTVLLLVVGCAVFFSLRADRVEKVVEREVPLPVPTSQATLIKLKQLGARWKRNQHGQVYWLFLKRLPLADDDLLVLKELPEVQTLTLRGVHTIKGNRFTDEGLRHLVHLPKLRYLDLSVNFRLTDAGLRYLVPLKKLKHLDLSGCRRFTDACGASLAQLTSLQTLKLIQTSFTPEVLTDLSQLPKLKHLAVNYTKGMWLDKNTIVPLEKMPLEELEGLRIKDENLPLIARLKSLKSLPFEQDRSIKDDQLRYLIHIRQIKKLNVVLTRGISDTSQLKQLRMLPELETLSISFGKNSEGNPLDRSGLLALAKIPTLKELGIGLVNVPVLEAISHCTQVQKLYLNVDTSQFQPTDLAYLKEMSRLKDVTVQIALVSDDLWETLAKVKSLEEISFNRGWPPQKEPPPFSMTSLKQLQNLPHLKGLDLNGFPVTDEGLGYLGQCRTLERLDMDKAPITNAGLLQLRHLSQLKKLSFYGSKIDESAAIELHEHIPQCWIEDNWCCGCMAINPVAQTK